MILTGQLNDSVPDFASSNRVRLPLPPDSQQTSGIKPARQQT